MDCTAATRTPCVSTWWGATAAPVSPGTPATEPFVKVSATMLAVPVLPQACREQPGNWTKSIAVRLFVFLN